MIPPDVTLYLALVALVAAIGVIRFAARRSGRERCANCDGLQPRRAVYQHQNGRWYCDDGAACQARAESAALAAAGHAAGLSRYAAAPASVPARPTLHPAVGEFLASSGRYCVRVQFSGENYRWWLGPVGQYVLDQREAHRGAGGQAERLADCIQLWNPGSTALPVMG